MIDRFLRLFSKYRLLKVHIEDLGIRCDRLRDERLEQQSDKLRIQDHNNWLSAELERTRQERDRWAKEALECNKMLANVGWQGRNNWVPWPESGRLPQEYVDAEKPGPVSADNLRVQDQARRESADVMDKYFEKHPQFKRR